MAAFLSQDEKLVNAYLDDQDVYSIIASSIYNMPYEDCLEFYPAGTELDIDGKKVIAGNKTHLNKAGKERRATGKTMVLAGNYGMSGAGAGSLMGKTAKDGQELLDKYFEMFSGLKKAIDVSKQALKDNGYVEDIVGRRRRLEDIGIDPYEARLKYPQDTSARFNPFLICGDRQDFNDPETVWSMILSAYGIMSTAQHIALGEKFEAGSMYNETFNKLKKIANDPIRLLSEKYSDNKYSKTNFEKIMTDLQTTFDTILNKKRYVGIAYKNKQKINLDCSLADEYGDYKNSELRRIISNYISKYGKHYPDKIPNDPVNLFAWTGRIAQAGRQCFNASIQGCLSADTKIYTKEGVINISDAVNKKIDVWDGKAWSKAVVKSSGKKQKCILTTTLNNRIICSPDHKFLVVNTKGKESFKKLKDILSQDRLIINENDPSIKNNLLLRDIFPQNYKTTHNKHNYSFDDIKDDYIRGQILGRIASDGSYGKKTKEKSGYIHILVAEHEKELLEYFRRYLPYNFKETVYQKKNQKIYRIDIASTTLAIECLNLDIKHKIHPYFYQNIDCLRGFISGFFDGDGTASNDHICLDFGTQADFSNIINQIQEALLIFGIRSVAKHYKDRYRVSIRKFDAIKFANRINFISNNKQIAISKIKTVHDNHCFANKSVVCIKNIEITDEYVEMYDVCDTERGYFIADGFVTHNSSATLTKKAMIDIFNNSRLNELGVKLIITVHDEVLVECKEEYAEEVKKLLPQIMVNAAKEIGVTLPMKCDPFNVSRWYCDEYAVAIQEEFKKLEAKGLSRDEALAKVIKNHTEVPEAAIIKTIETGCDLDF